MAVGRWRSAVAGVLRSHALTPRQLRALQQCGRGDFSQVAPDTVECLAALDLLQRSAGSAPLELTELGRRQLSHSELWRSYPTFM